MRLCPISPAAAGAAWSDGCGKRWLPASLIAPATSSAGLFTFSKRARLKKSALNSVRSVARTDPPESK